MHGMSDASLAPRYSRWRIQIFVITWLAYAGYLVLLSLAVIVLTLVAAVLLSLRRIAREERQPA